MTVSSDIRVAGPYTSGTILPFAFKVFDASDIVVVKADTDGVESILTEGPDYTVTLSPDQNDTPGGSVTLAAAISAGEKVVVAGALEVLQGTSIPNNSGFFAAVIEDALDRATIQIQELREKSSRSVKVPVTSTQTPEELLEDLLGAEQNASASAAAAAASADSASDSADSASDSADSASDSAAEALALSALFKPNIYLPPGPLFNVTPQTVTVFPCGYFEGLLWGRDGSNRLLTSGDMGLNWTLVSSVVDRTPQQVYRCADGEILVQGVAGLSKSSGWPTNPATATWNTVLSRPVGNVADFLKWGTDGDGQKFIATHYSSVRSDSRYVWISTDAGSTFTEVWDSNTVDPANNSHIHAACYDPWQDRFYFTEGHSTLVGIYYSDDDGGNWTKITNDLINGTPREPQFTTMMATDFGIVCGTDGHPNGVWLLRRSENPDDLALDYMGAWSKQVNGVNGFADHSFRDPDTGIVYVGFGNAGGVFAGVPNVIFGVGASGAKIVYSGAASRVFSVYAGGGKLVAQVGTAASTSWLRAETSKYTDFTDMLRAADRGNLNLDAGDYTDNRSIRLGNGSTARGLEAMALGRQSTASQQLATAIGQAAVASALRALAIGITAQATSQSAIAYGYGAIASGLDSIAIGYLAASTNSNSVAIGKSAAAAQGIAIGANAASTSNPQAIAIGQGSAADGGVALGLDSICNGAFANAVGRIAQATTTGATAYGYDAQATGVDSTAIGRRSRASNTESVAIGENAKAQANTATAVGVDTVATGTGAVALGFNAQATHNNAVALGINSATARTNSVMVGNKDIESTKVGGGFYLLSPDGTLYFVSVANGGTLSIVAA